MEKKIKKQLQEFLSQGKCSVTMLVGNYLKMDSVCFANFMQINQFIFIDGDQNTSDGVFLFNVADENEEDVLVKLILTLNNLHFLHQEENTLIYAYTALVADIENVDPYPFIIFERN